MAAKKLTTYAIDLFEADTVVLVDAKSRMAALRILKDKFDKNDQTLLENGEPFTIAAHGRPSKGGIWTDYEERAGDFLPSGEKPDIVLYRSLTGRSAR